MNVLWILNGCGLEGGSITGGPVRFHEVSRRFASAMESQRLMTTSGGETMLRGMGCDIPAIPVPASLFLHREPCRAFRLWSYLVSALCAPSAIRKTFAETASPPDCAITVSDYFCDVVPALAAKRRFGCKWIAWIHHRELPPSQRPGNRLVNALTYRMQEWSLRQIARHADAAWVYDTDAGDLIRERLLHWGMASDLVRTMLNGINCSDIAKAPEPSEKTADAVMIGVRPNKGLHDILPIWEKVLAMRPGTTLRLMGGMSGEADTLEAIRQRGLDRWITVFRPQGGFLPSSEYYAKIKEARILFAPSHEEGWGIVLCEAMAAGLPVVAYDLPVYRRIYGKDIRSVPRFDFAAFAHAIVEMLDRREVFDRYREQGLRRSSTYDWDSVAESDATALRDLFGNTQPGE